MDTLLQVGPDLKFENGSVSCCSGKKLVHPPKPSCTEESRNTYHQPFQGPESQKSSSSSSSSSLSLSLSLDSPPSFDGDHLDSNDSAVLKFINDILMEEDLEGQTCMLQDCLALQATEKSFNEVLNEPSSLRNDGHDGLGDSHIPCIGANPYIQATSFSESPKSFVYGDAEPFAPIRALEGRYHHRDDDSDVEDGRRNKQPAISLPDMEQPEMFDEVLLCKAEAEESSSWSSLHHNRNGRSRGSTRGAKGHSKKTEAVDLWTLLTQCAQALTNFDQRTATEMLKQIRLHASQFGDGMQRMAFYFSDALEARLVGTRTPAYSPLVCNRCSVVDILNAYKMYVEACPFKKMSNFLANRSIGKLAAEATSLHIIDFGILYGFQWPCLIQTLSRRPGGPPRLKITGIELPQPGFRPAQRVKETGHRLKRYCERFNVPFEYHSIAQKWETITLGDLKIDRDETTVVNCLYRLKHVLDETFSVNSPRDTFLNLIKDINPDLFVHGVVNGTYNAPFFMTRFREALFHFSAVFDMFEATIPREEEHRMLYEREIFARDLMNVLACEGAERVERPETYKQWQVRNLRAGFRQVELDEEIVKKVEAMVKSRYHRDFVIDVNGQWMLQGWKGRVLYALSCWKPLQK